MSRRTSTVVVLVAGAAAFMVSLYFVRQLTGIASAWFGLLLMMCVLGLFTLARAAFLPRMPAPLRAIRTWEKDAVMYRRLGVPRFGRLLRVSPLRYLNPQVYLCGHEGDAAAIAAQAEAAEAAHLWGALVLLPWLLGAAQKLQWTALGALAMAEVVGNIYPMLHLRLTRARIEVLLRRRSARAAVEARALVPRSPKPRTGSRPQGSERLDR